MIWQKKVGRELKYFLLIVLISFLFWLSLAVIIEQSIIAPEYLYSKERNGFILTILFFYFIRLNACMINKRDTHDDRERKTEDPLIQEDRTRHSGIIGIAKNENEPLTTFVKNEWMISEGSQETPEGNGI